MNLADSIPTVRRLFRWIFSRYGLFAAACLATLLALFYTIENWRGRRAWEACKRDLEAKGENLDWMSYVSRPVPDDQNMVKGIESLFLTGGHLKDTFFTLDLRKFRQGITPSALAEVVILLPGMAAPAGAMIYDFADLATGRNRIQLDTAVMPGGRWFEGCQNILLCERPAGQQATPRVFIRSDKLPEEKGILDLLMPGDIPTRMAIFQTTNTFSVQPNLEYNCTAAEYLSGTESMVPELEMIRKAAERPFAHWEMDAREPFNIPMQVLVRMRSCCQVIAQRAQAHLLLGQPDQALHDLELILAMQRLMGGYPPSLVIAMINSAVGRLYVNVVEDGLRTGLWQEPQLRSLGEQLRRIDTLSPFEQGMKSERAAVFYILDTYPRGRLPAVLLGKKEANWQNAPGTFAFFNLCPRGWIDQNKATIARLQDVISAGVKAKNHRIEVAKVPTATQLDAMANSFSPYKIIGRYAIPNVVRAITVLAQNQVRVQQAIIACALERFRLEHGKYPDSLEWLSPELPERIPVDPLTGTPFLYRLKDGIFTLWSVGWNMTDEGGIKGRDDTSGDWVWLGKRH